MQVAFHLVVGLGKELFLVRVLEDVPDPLAFGGLQLLPEVLQHLVQMVGRLFGLGDLVVLPGEIGVQLIQHLGGVVHQPFDIDFEELVQLVHPDVVAGAAGEPPAVVAAAGVGSREVAAAH